MFGKIPAFVAPLLPQLTGFQAKVYMVLALRCDWHTREISISYPALAKALGLKDKKRVEDAVKELRRLGLVAEIPGKKGVSNRYFLPLEEGEEHQGPKRPLPQTTRGQNDPYPGAKMTPTPGAKMTPHYKKSLDKNPIQEAQRALPDGQAGAGPYVPQCHLSDICPECGAVTVGEGRCPSCGWDFGQLSIPAEETSTNPAEDMCPRCKVALQPDGTCWKCNQTPAEARESLEKEQQAAATTQLPDANRPESGGQKPGKESEDFASGAFSEAETVSSPKNDEKALTEASEGL